MTKNNKLIWPILNLIIYLGLATFAFLICSHSQQSISLKSQIAASLDVEGSADLAVDELLEKISFSLYKGASERVDEHKKMLASSETERKKSFEFAFYFLVIALSWLIFKYLHANKKNDKYIFWRHALIVSILCLFVGLIAPMMQMTAYKELPVLGDVIFKYEAKSINSTVIGLFTHGNYIIAGLIAIFSIITPLFKMSVVGMSLFDVAPSLHKKAHHLIHLLGKWSMADVFVVAILISIFALDSQDFTKAETDLGVYFFTAYCLLSLWVTHAVLKEPEEIESTTTVT